MARRAPAKPSPGPYLAPDAQRALKNRLARIEGHVRSIGTMIESREWADEILLQVTAVKGALNRFAAVLVEQELEACLSHCKDPAEREMRIDKLTRIIATMLKQS